MAAAATRDQATALFRIVQEALTNVSRHARATLVNIILEQRDGDLALEVRDNGVGISPEAIANPVPSVFSACASAQL